jgi:cell wall-associated NlpC family hydrolase
MGQTILTKSAQNEALGEQLKQAQLDLRTATQTTATTLTAYQDAQDSVTTLRSKAGSTAAQAYKDATALGPYANYTNDVHGLDLLAPGLRLGDSSSGGPAGSQVAAQNLAKAEQQEANTRAAYQSAQATQQQKQTEEATLEAQFNQSSTELANLRSQNSAAVAQAEAAQEAQDQSLAGSFAAGTSVNGLVANPKALAAVRAAMTKLGDRYLFATEGPDTFDCSGLVWWAYRQAGVTSLPRIANDQFHATTSIPVGQLLPGDLVFFSTTSKTDWTTISHVGMYVGDGKMIEAPTTGDVVKIATVWWSAFFGATRVVSAVAAPTSSPTTPTLAPAPTTPGARPTTGAPSTTPTSGAPSTTPSTSPTPSPSPTPTPSQTPSATVSTSESTSDSTGSASASSSASTGS